MPIPLSRIDAQKTLFAGNSVLLFTLVAALTGATAAIGTSVTLANHGLTLNQAVKFLSGTGGTGLVAGTTYYAQPVDATTFRLAATLDGTPINITTALSAGVFQPQLVLKSRMVDHEIDQEEKSLEAPDDTGVLRDVATVLTKQKERFKFELVEPKRLLDIFGGGLAGYLANKTVEIWAPDPRDASGKVALKSESFACTITRDGNLKLGDSDFSKASIKVASNKQGVILWTQDAAV